METYPSIPKNISREHIFAFDKIDGSNIRAEWSRKSGFTKFGTRTRLMDETDPMYGEAVTLFKDKYADDLEERFRKAKFERATAFCEFAGEHSFAGQHEDEPHDVTLFDIHVYKRGILPPREFLELTHHLDIAELLYEGKPTEQFITKVREGTLDGMTFEGVVCKGGLDNRRRVTMFKIKNKAWLERLHTYCGDNEALFNKLA